MLRTTIGTLQLLQDSERSWSWPMYAHEAWTVLIAVPASTTAPMSYNMVL